MLVWCFPCTLIPWQTISKYLFLAHYYPKLKQSNVFLHPWWFSSFYSSIIYYPPNLLHPLFWYTYYAVESLWFIICFISKFVQRTGVSFLGDTSDIILLKHENKLFSNTSTTLSESVRWTLPHVKNCVIFSGLGYSKLYPYFGNLIF